MRIFLYITTEFLTTSSYIEDRITPGGTFPSSPASIWMPGTDIASNVSGYLPLYNKPSGIFNLVRKPVLNLRYDSYGQGEQDGGEHTVPFTAPLSATGTFRT